MENAREENGMQVRVQNTKLGISTFWTLERFQNNMAAMRELEQVEDITLSMHFWSGFLSKCVRWQTFLMYQWQNRGFLNYHKGSISDGLNNLLIRNVSENLTSNN